MHRFCRLAAALLPLAPLVACGGEPPPPPYAPPPATNQVTYARPPAPQTLIVRRTVVMNARPSGSSVETFAPDGTVTVAFDVLENGRGPHTDATIRLAPDGTIASYAAHGHHEVGAPVEETFAIEGGQAHWKSREESGDQPLAGPAFFVPLSDLPDTLGLLVQALIKAGGTLPILPSGQAHAERVAETAVTANGLAKHLTLYDVTGLDLLPIHVWMEDDDTWFGFIDPDFSVVPDGFEGVIEQLVLQQRQLDQERDKKLAEHLRHTLPAAGLALTHARVLDVERGQWLKDFTVIVVGDTIKAVGPSGALRPPRGAEVVDLAGKGVMPGLWDMHAHLGPADGPMDIASGVTTVRDVGNDPDRLDDLKARFDSGDAIGPHVLRAGFIEGRGENAAASKVTAETEAEAKAAVELYAKRGYEMIKIYNSVKPELVPIIAKEAHARGMTVTGHIPVHMLANEAVKAGYDGIEHVNMLFLNFLADHDTDTRTPRRFTLVGDKAGDLDLSSKPVREFLGLLRDHHTVVDPTFDAFEDLLLARQGTVTPGLEWMADRMPPHVRRSFLVGSLPLEGKEEAYAKSWQNVLHMVRALHDAKVTTVVGTDELGGLYLDHELELFVRGGLSTAEALRDATIVPARAMKLDKKYGSVAPGKVADLAIVDGDPLADIRDVRKVVNTVRAGVAYASHDLFATMSVKDWR
jgi:hypothetical protein